MCCCGKIPLVVTKMFLRSRYQKLWKSYVKLRHLLANSPKVKHVDKQKLTQREVRNNSKFHVFFVFFIRSL